MKYEKERGTVRNDCPTRVHSGWARMTRAPRGLLLGGACFCGFHFSGGVGVFLGEALDAAGGVNELLLASEEGMAIRADFDIQLVAFDRRTSREIVAAGAVHRNGMIVGVDTISRLVRRSKATS